MLLSLLPSLANTGPGTRQVPKEGLLSLMESDTALGSGPPARCPHLLMAQKAVRRAGDLERVTGDQVLENAQAKCSPSPANPFAGGFFKNGLPGLVAHAATFSQGHLSHLPLSSLGRIFAEI